MGLRGAIPESTKGNATCGATRGAALAELPERVGRALMRRIQYARLPHAFCPSAEVGR